MRDASGLPLSRTTIPIRAWKRATVGLDPWKRTGNRYAFHPVSRGRAYGADAVSDCAVGHDGHNKGKPQPDCSCGFYAYKSLRLAIEHDGLDRTTHTGFVILEVELLGRVIVCRRGYRAGRQRILRAYFPRFCARCHNLTTGAFSSHDQLLSACSEHQTMTFEEVAQLVGTEVALAPEPPALSMEVFHTLVTILLVTAYSIAAVAVMDLFPNPLLFFAVAIVVGGLVSTRLTDMIMAARRRRVWKGYH